MHPYFWNGRRWWYDTIQLNGPRGGYTARLLDPRTWNVRLSPRPAATEMIAHGLALQYIGASDFNHGRPDLDWDVVG